VRKLNETTERGPDRSAPRKLEVPLRELEEPAAPSYASDVVTCASCGQQNTADARFCNACGTELATLAREVRKTVTVVFADVTGSTALGERLDAESLRQVMARYFDVARSCLERHGGTVEKFIGDAVMGVFGVPTLHEDDALRALRATAELRNSLASLNEELTRDYGVSLRLRTGVNSGEVVTGTEERLATGDAVNVAARLEQAAQPGEILVGEQTWQLARGAIEAEALDLSLKGKAEPLRAYRLVRVIEDVPGFDRRLDAPLVGRRQDLAHLRAAFDRALSERRCRLVTLLGPLGIGKSRLARELAEAISSETAILSGRCLPYGEGITYWPLAQIFGEADAEDELAAALSAGAPEEISWSVRKALEARARERPLLLMFEDIHWAEPTLLDLIEHLAEWTRDAPILLLCLARPELLDERPAWPGDRTTLEPLSEAESDELIEKLLGGSLLEAVTRARIRDVAEGNPLFVEQLLRTPAAEGDVAHVPPTMHALLAARLDALPADERALLEHASIIGLEFDWDALGELDPGRRRPPGARLAALVRKQLIRPHEASEDSFRFRHMLIRDAAYARVPKERRSQLHERVSDWLDGRGEEFEEIVGWHLEQAYRSAADLGLLSDRGQRLAERAAERLAASARRAHARGDARAETNLLERATGLLPPDDRRRLGLLPSLGRALLDAGELARADSALSEAVERALASGERRVAAHANVALAEVRWWKAQADPREILRELESAIPVFREVGDEAGLARALRTAGVLRWNTGETAVAVADLERAARCARVARDRALEAECLGWLMGAILWGPMSATEALERIDALASRGEWNRTLELAFLRSRAQLEAMQGRFEAARNTVEQAKKLTEELGSQRWVEVVAFAAGYVELLAGDFPAAERELRRACDTAERMDDWSRFATAAPRLAEALLRQGRDEEAMALTEVTERVALADDVDPQIAWRRVRARLLARSGNIEKAERLAREATALVARTDLLNDHAEAIADLADVLLLAGRTNEAATALQEAVELFEKKGNIAAAEMLRL
jgi:class 3 adenylate cyclase/tetratricopeptide (TPR) repeat protein